MQYYVSKEDVEAILQEQGTTVLEFLVDAAPIPDSLYKLIQRGGPTRDAVLIGELEELLQTSSTRFVLLKKESFDGFEPQSRHADDSLDSDITHFERDTRGDLLRRALTFRRPEELSQQEKNDLDEELRLRRLSTEVAIQQCHRDPSSFDSKTQEELLKWEKRLEKDEGAEPVS